MLKQVKSAVLRALREVASLPLRTLGNRERDRVLEKLTGSMISELRLPKRPLRFMTSTPLLQTRANSILLKEPDTIQWIDRFEPSDVFWDVGANVGIFSLYAARRREVKVLAFEPSADNYMVLCRNVEINALERFVPYCMRSPGTPNWMCSIRRRANWEAPCISSEGVGKLHATGTVTPISVRREWSGSRLTISSDSSSHRFPRA
jgi:hypothetical protein